MAELVGAIDQGTSSTRFLVVDPEGHVVASAQAEHKQIFPRPGWVEHDPMEIWEATCSVVERALSVAGISARDLRAVGITNQRETTVIWDRATGVPVANAIVWQDTRTADLCDQLGAELGEADVRSRTGLPVATYFSGPKIRWLLDELELHDAAAKGDLAFGTIDSWLTWKLTGRHVTDVTNASRTMLMDLATTTWDSDLAVALGVPSTLLPEIVPSVSSLGECGPPLDGVPLTAVFGDQHAALFGQVCFGVGDVKNTYGTGNFMLMNVGSEPVASSAGLLSTVGYQLEGQSPIYALEGSIAVTGSLVQWLRDNLGIIQTAEEVNDLAGSVDDNGDVYVVPAFSGLFAPHWRQDARGVIVGLTRYADKRHIARAALEAAAFQTRDIVESMKADAGASITSLKVDGGMTSSDLLMQFQSDLLGVEVVRPVIAETTALGAAMGAGFGSGVWESLDELSGLWRPDRTWRPQMDEHEAARLYGRWGDAVERSLGWV